MKLIFAGNGRRGSACLQALLVSVHEPQVVIAHIGATEVPELARSAGLPVLTPGDVNDLALISALRDYDADLVVLAGYGQIVKQQLIALTPLGCLNLHAGRLPQYRGSSPLNWALLRGESEVTLSVIQVDEGVDTGDVLAERSFPISPVDTIADLHELANATFPDLLLETLDRASRGVLTPRRQDESDAAYFPLRFPDDGLILWDLVTAEVAHNTIRALTDPYPGAFTFHGSRRLRILRSRLTERPVFGEPGRIYRLAPDAALVCASDRCLWIEEAILDDGGNGFDLIERYDRLATARWLAVEKLSEVTR